MRLLPAVLSAVLTALSAAPIAAQEGGNFAIGGDVFAVGATVGLTEAVAGSLFVAGNTVEQTGAVAGSAHLAGQNVTVAAPVGENLYAAGYAVTVRGPVTGDATLAGYSVAVEAAVGRNLRASGATVSVAGPVAGAALLSGQDVAIGGVIAGDVAITAGTLTFGEGARLDGHVSLYETSPGALTVPESVADPARITRYASTAWEGEGTPPALAQPDWRQRALRRLGSIGVVALLAALAAAVLPRGMAGLRQRLADRPFAALGWGFLALSALVGSVVVAGLTVVGLLLAPVSILLAVVTGFAGYIVGVWTLGAGAFARFGAGEPDTLPQTALAAALGAVLVGLLGRIPSSAGSSSLG
jgi:hypothetical protein